AFEVKFERRNVIREIGQIAPVICSLRSILEALIPSPQLSTIRVRNAMACADFGRRAIMPSLSCSSVVISRGFLGRPVRIPKYARCFILFNAFLAHGSSAAWAWSRPRHRIRGWFETQLVPPGGPHAPGAGPRAPPCALD